MWYHYNIFTELQQFPCSFVGKQAVWGMIDDMDCNECNVFDQKYFDIKR